MTGGIRIIQRSLSPWLEIPRQDDVYASNDDEDMDEGVDNGAESCMALLRVFIPFFLYFHPRMKPRETLSLSLGSF